MRRLLPILALVAACSSPEIGAPPAGDARPLRSAAADPERRVISIIGTNDLHGRVAALPLLAGYVQNLRDVRARDGGLVLLDAGDMFQGTLESNLAEGLPVVSAYAAMGYHAVTIGNHEFDFGPVGPKATPTSPSDDPQGALKAAAKAAAFPFLSSNLLVQDRSARIDWPNVEPSVLIEVAGTKIGLVGATTRETLESTISANVKNLAMAAIPQAAGAEAKKLRDRGAAVVVLLAHAGGKCKTFTGNADADLCEATSEIFEVARALPPGSVDVIVAGHSHAGVAHEVAGVAIIESFSYGRAFGRVDLVVEGGRVASKKVFAPQDLCPGDEKPDFAVCQPVTYEGRAVTRDARVEREIAPAVDGAKQKREELVGVELPDGIGRAYDRESALGNLFADLLRAAHPGAHVGLVNGGGLRADLPKGQLRYGALYEAFPFDNRLAVVELSGRDLRRVVRGHLTRGGGILSFSGLRVVASCRGDDLRVELEREGKAGPVRDEEALTVVASDFMFTGGDGFWGDVQAPKVLVKDDLMRDALEIGLGKLGKVRAADVFDAKRPRVTLPGRRPVVCKE